MKNLKRLMRGLICSLIVIVLCTTILGGCKFFSSSKLSTPSVTINKDKKTITFDANYSASSYEIYINEKVVATIDEEASGSQHSFNYSEYLPKNGDGNTAPGEYRIQVKAIGGSQYLASKKSDAVTAIYGTAVDMLDKNVSVFDGNNVEYLSDEKFNPNNVVLNKKTLTWDEPTNKENLTNYVVSVFSNTLGVKNIVTNKKTYTLTENEIVSHDVVAIRVSAVYSDGSFYASDVKYYNPMDTDLRGKFTDTIYVFKGGVYDYFIENWDELKNIYYYAFIYRIENLDFLVLGDFYLAYSDTYFDTMTNNANDYILQYAYFETYGFSATPALAKGVSKGNDRGFNLSCEFIEAECDYTTASKNTASVEQGVITPYYETIKESSTYQKRNEETHKFVSDIQMLTTKVESSEQLLWAVTNHVTPIFKNKTCRAYLIYEKAKAILNKIIYDGMTDYEKVLCIFDYIMNNSTYDYNTYYAGSSVNPMDRACYYLEGLFLSEGKVVVCDAMSKSFALLCNMEGINAVRIIGSAGTGSEKGGHAWNKVYVDGSWYVVDITWTELLSSKDTYVRYNTDWRKNYDNPYYYYFHQNDTEFACHTYFMVDDKFIADTHVQFDNEALYKVMPTTTSVDYFNKPYYTIGSNSYDRVIDSESDLKIAIEYLLKNDLPNIELIFDKKYVVDNGADIVAILKNCKKLFSGCSVVINRDQIYDITRMEYDEEGMSFNTGIGSTTVHYYLPETYLLVTYNTNGDEGVLVFLTATANLSSQKRLTEYLEFVINNNVSHSSNVTITREFMEQVTGKTEEAEQIAAFETLINNAFIAKGISKSVTITTVERKKTQETSLVQQDDGKTYVKQTNYNDVYNLVFGSK